MPEHDQTDRSLAPAVSVIGAWIAQRASELDLEPSLLATRADLAQLLNTADGRLATGWRPTSSARRLRRCSRATPRSCYATAAAAIELQER